MVLKRKRGDSFVPATSSQELELPATAGSSSNQPSPPKKTRTNPPRAKRSGTAASTAGASSSTASALPKKSRGPRKKNVYAPVATSSTAVAGPSSQPSAPVKKGRKKKVDNEVEDQSGPEKRKAQFKPKCPQNILDRVERVLSQRIFMLDRQREEGELRETFSVLGSTGNVYTVTIDHLPRCNCPDAVRGNHCKHILFVFLKVLAVPRESSFWYQKALLTSELEQIFAQARLAPNAHAHARVREAYARAMGKTVADSAIPDKSKRLPSEEDDCPICYDGMHGVAEASLVFCEECGNAVHKECFAEWRKTAQNKGNDLTCVYCRARWVAPAPPSSGAAQRKQGGYLNLANVAGLSTARDTSTYYHGPQSGHRYYGYNTYNDDLS